MIPCGLLWKAGNTTPTTKKIKWMFLHQTKPDLKFVCCQLHLPCQGHPEHWRLTSVPIVTSWMWGHQQQLKVSSHLKPPVHFWCRFPSFWWHLTWWHLTALLYFKTKKFWNINALCWQFMFIRVSWQFMLIRVSYRIGYVLESQLSCQLCSWVKYYICYIYESVITQVMFMRVSYNMGTPVRYTTAKYYNAKMWMWWSDLFG